MPENESALNETSANDTPHDELAAAKRERDDLYDRLLRMTAEFDNYRKRTERERREFAEAAGVDVIRELLPVLDDFERALATQPESTGMSSDAAERYRRGVELIHRRTLDLLRKRGFDVPGAAPAAAAPARRTTAKAATAPRTPRRTTTPRASEPEKPPAVCPTCFTVLPATGICDDCG